MDFEASGEKPFHRVKKNARQNQLYLKKKYPTRQTKSQETSNTMTQLKNRAMFKGLCAKGRQKLGWLD